MVKKVIKKIVGKKHIDKYQEYKRKRIILENEMSNKDKTVVEEVWLKNVILAHSIEKSMAIRDVHSLVNMTRYTNGISNSIFLIQNGLPVDNFAITEAIGVIGAALIFIKKEKLEVNAKEFEAVERALDRFVEDYQPSLINAFGVSGYTKDELDIGKTYDWTSFVTTRHSIRAFTNKIIEQATIEQVLNTAKYYPSACNRQPCKVYYSRSEEILKEISLYVNDSRTVKNSIHNFFIVTCDKNKFMEGELYQYYINGGIFLGYLVLSLHSQGLGSCIFQYVQVNQKNKEFREKFKIPNNEIIIAFVGFGELLEDNQILCAARQNLADIAVEIQ